MCLFPVRAEPQEFGRPKLDTEGSILLPCGKCSECISKRAMEWALRARHEISDHDENCFLTLTYDDDNLPSFLIVKDKFKEFMKRLRKKVVPPCPYDKKLEPELHKEWIRKNGIRYMVSHEYGGQTGRPHHHVIIFGYNPPNQKYLHDAPSGASLFTSEEIGLLWPHGYHSIGEANEKTAYYIASYSLKSCSHLVTNPENGEIHKVSDSMDSSKCPAIGLEYFKRNVKQLLDTETFLPRYYQKILEREYPDLFEQYQNDRLLQIGEAPQRGAHQKLAKYVKTTQQQQESKNTYRQSQENKTLIQVQKQNLIGDRNNYVKSSLRRKNEN